MDYTITVRFSSEEPFAPVDLVTAIKSIAPYMVDNVTVTTEKGA